MIWSESQQCESWPNQFSIRNILKTFMTRSLYFHQAVMLTAKSWLGSCLPISLRRFKNNLRLELDKHKNTPFLLLPDQLPWTELKASSKLHFCSSSSFFLCIRSASVRWNRKNILIANRWKSNYLCCLLIWVTQANRSAHPFLHFWYWSSICTYA